MRVGVIVKENGKVKALVKNEEPIVFPNWYTPDSLFEAQPLEPTGIILIREQDIFDAFVILQAYSVKKMIEQSTKWRDESHDEKLD